MEHHASALERAALCPFMLALVLMGYAWAMNTLFAMALAGLCGLSGCADATHAVKASDYNRSCVQDKDCISIYQGELTCCGPSCPNAAINQADSERYSNDLDSRTPSCSPPPPCAGLLYCREVPATCVDHVCELPTQVDAGS